MAVKKAYVEIVNLLEANLEQPVKNVIDEVIALASAKSGGGGGIARSYIKDKENVVVAIFDYYYKKWMPLVGDDAVEYGSKANSATGYNTMCKEGVRLWTKQQNDYKKAMGSILERLEAGEMAVEDIAEVKAEAEAEKTKIEETDFGFETKAEVIEYLLEAGFEVESEDSE